MRIALTGISGFLGSHIARDLVAAGHEVVGLVRETSRRDHIEPYVSRFVTGDQADETVWEEFVHGSDCVIHNSFDWSLIKDGPKRSRGLRDHFRNNLAASLRFLEITNPRQFIYMSSIGVHHDMLQRTKSTDGINIVNEDHPLRPNSWYGACKAAVEAHLWTEHYARSRNTCAIRPCAVYGISPNLDRSHGYDIVRELRRERRYHQVGGGKFVHVDDVSRSVVACVGNAKAAGKAFNLVDCYARWSDWATIAAGVMGVRADIPEPSRAKPDNMFDSALVDRLLGVPLQRGHEGIRTHLMELITEMDRLGVGA